MADNKTVFCVELPVLDSIPKITLPLGGELSGFADFSLSMPTKCTANFSLLVQIAPLLASITCLIEVLGVIAALKDFASNPLMKGPDLLKAIEKVVGCIPIAPFPNFLLTIKGLLQLIIQFLLCFISEVESLLNFQANIQISMDSAGDNPALMVALGCAKKNADASMAGLMQSLAPLKPLLDLMNTVGGVVGLPTIQLSFDMSGAKDEVEVLDKLKQTIQTISGIVDSIPG